MVSFVGTSYAMGKYAQKVDYHEIVIQSFAAFEKETVDRLARIETKIDDLGK